jgi:hypothetical protein
VVLDGLTEPVVTCSPFVTDAMKEIRWGNQGYRDGAMGMIDIPIGTWWE